MASAPLAQRLNLSFLTSSKLPRFRVGLGLFHLESLTLFYCLLTVSWCLPRLKT